MFKKNNDLHELAAIYRDLKLDPKYMDQFMPHLLGAPDDEDRWIDVATTLRKIRFDKCCEATYEMALQRFPKSHRLWNNQGVLFRYQKRFGQAVQSLQKALSIKPDYAIAMSNLGNTYEVSKNFLDASEWYQRAININPRDAFACNGLANCLFVLGEDDDDKAFDYYRQAIAIDPDYAEPQFNIVVQLIRRGRREQAKDELQAYVKKWPEDEEAQSLLVKISDSLKPLPGIRNASVPDRKKIVIRPIDNTDYENSGNTAKPATETPSRSFTRLSEYAKLSREQAVAQGNTGFYDKAVLWKMVKECVEKTEPPEDTRIFLSYRRENEQHMAWMRKLANELDERGYDVMLDQFIRGLTQSPSVPEMISMMATCNVFAPILTDGYFERIDVGDGPIVSHMFGDDGWVFDEYQVASYLVNNHLMGVVGMWRSGRLRGIFTEDNTLDLRNDRKMEEELDLLFPRRKLLAIAVRENKTGRMKGISKFSQIADTVKMLQDTGEFKEIQVVIKPANE